MIIFGTCVATCTYSGEFQSGDIFDLINKGYAFAFQAISVDFELHMPSFADLASLNEIMKVAEYFQALKDFTKYSPTYLLTGSRVVSLLSFFFAFLKTGSGMLLSVVDLYGKFTDGKVKIGQGARLIEVTLAQKNLKEDPKTDPTVLKNLLKECRNDGVSAWSLRKLGIVPDELSYAGYSREEVDDAQQRFRKEQEKKYEEEQKKEEEQEKKYGMHYGDDVAGVRSSYV